MDLDTLNKEQKEAVLTTEGPLLVIAGAGSGKTRVLTTRIAYLIEELKVDPYNILAITFTNKAAREMKERVIKLIGNSFYGMQISTFHSFGLSILRKNCKLLGYEDNFTIIDSDDSLTIIKKIIKDLNLDSKIYNPKAIKNRISGAKNELLDPDSYSKYANSDFEEKVVEIYRKYQDKLLNNNSVDFDDLLMLPIKLLKNNEDVLKKYQERFKYVLIDEYQDTNEAQYVLTKMVSAKYKNICVVGDESQSIYSFRGANYKNILNFEKDYKNTKTILLEENYRSTKYILNAANDIIKNNINRKDKKLWTSNSEGNKVKYYRASNEKDEAYHVTKEIKDLIVNGVKKSEIAILYRTNAQSRNMEEALLKENIPYKVVGSFFFYKRKEIKDLIAYLKLIYNSNDDTSLSRIINVPKRGIGTKTIENLEILANSKNISMYDAISKGKELEFKKLIEEIKLEEKNLSLTELIDLILDKTGIKEELISEKSLESDIRLENLEEFKSITKNFEERYGIISLQAFLEEISLVSDIEEHNDNTDLVTLMTVHSAKGLEFDNVFIIGLEEGLFPHTNSLTNHEEIEEERRLIYVAITRAKRRLELVNAKKRVIYGNESNNLPSRFINEINKDNLEQAKEEVKIEKEDYIDCNVSYKFGDKVEHDIYGIGIIVGIKDKTVDVAFKQEYGIKTFIKGHKVIRKANY
ncbi:MAG: UvrD-helicase domain-containing protein [Bacilli bacterium]|nr:UvrD-helicase domain-containing protein [Bacilli bacterium]